MVLYGGVYKIFFKKTGLDNGQSYFMLSAL